MKYEVLWHWKDAPGKLRQDVVEAPDLIGAQMEVEDLHAHTAEQRDEMAFLAIYPAIFTLKSREPKP